MKIGTVELLKVEPCYIWEAMNETVCYYNCTWIWKRRQVDRKMLAEDLGLRPMTWNFFDWHPMKVVLMNIFFAQADEKSKRLASLNRAKVHTLAKSFRRTARIFVSDQNLFNYQAKVIGI